jgi:signal transduction histidine kinase/DNA-binding response OmpR family regulator
MSTSSHTPVLAARALPESEPVAQERTNILIVDDRADKRIVFSTVLDGLGQNVITAGSGEEALRWLLDNECAVILLDVNMPGMDGLETAELIRSRRRSAHTPIIFITAFADEMHTARGYSLGAVDYILSPVVPNVLRSKVMAFVQLHRLNAELARRADERVALTREQMARSAAEESQRRATFLAEASQVMASSLDVDTILDGAARLVVPYLADYSLIVLADENGASRARKSSSVAIWERHIGKNFAAFDEMLGQALDRVIASGQRFSHEGLTGIGAAPTETGSFAAGELHALPLITRGQARGALILGLGPSARRLSGPDLALAESLAGRAASALDNCLLYEEIQNADRRKNEFLATLSHELRNPLAPLRSALHMLQGGKVDHDKSMTMLELMERQVGQIVHLVEDLLDVSRITRGAIELRREPLEIATEIRHALESCASALEACKHTVAVKFPSEPLHVVADRIRLQQILENLILNAAKYTDAGGRIEVSAESDLHGVAIRVRDNGIGIAREKLARVWDLFVQVDESPDRVRNGLGIGLALVRDLVKRHGGTVEAASEGLGMGSVFTVRLPRAVAPSHTGVAAQGTVKGPDVGARRVLVVDDNVDAAETLSMMLELLGQKTRQAHDGTSALRAVAEYHPELVFMDIGLPGLSGLEVASRIRRDLGMSDTYLIALSGYGTEEDRRKSLYAGFDNHLVKPLDPSSLPEILAAAGRRTLAGN